MASNTWAPSVRLLSSSGPMSLARASAKKCFWRLDTSFLQKLRDHLPDIEPSPAEGGECDLLFNMVTGILKCSDLEGLDVLKQRLALNDTAALFASNLIEMDECLEVMDPRDVQKVHHDQEDAVTHQRSHALFSSDFRQKVVTIRAKAAGPKPKAKAKGKAVAAPLRPHVAAEISHASAKTMLPKGCSIWRGLTKHTWNAHVPPRPRISEAWDGNQEASLTRILKRIWAQHLELEGKSWDDCPFVFD